MLFHQDFDRKPLVHAHLSGIASEIHRTLGAILTEEFWHIPKNAVVGKREESGVFDWVLALRQSKGKMLEHIPIVALEYKSGESLTLVSPKRKPLGPVVLIVGANDAPADVAAMVSELYWSEDIEFEKAEFLKTPGYQLRLHQKLAKKNTVALQEVALSDVATITEELKREIIRNLEPIEVKHDQVPGKRRFDLVVATPPPMCFALAAIEIDGSTHRKGNRGDNIKDSFCRVTGLPMIRIGIGTHLPGDQNQLQDDYLEYFAEWISKAVSGLKTDADNFLHFMESIRSIASDAEAQVKCDLLALIDRSTDSFERLQSVIYYGFDQNSNTQAARSFTVNADSPYLTITTAVTRRVGDDLYFDVEAAWEESTGIERPELLPEKKTEGPFRLKVIGTKPLRDRFYYFARMTFVKLHQKENENVARRYIKIDC